MMSKVWARRRNSSDEYQLCDVLGERSGLVFSDRGIGGLFDVGVMTTFILVNPPAGPPYEVKKIDTYPSKPNKKGERSEGKKK